MSKNAVSRIVLIAALALVGIECSALKAQTTDGDAWWR